MNYIKELLINKGFTTDQPTHGYMVGVGTVERGTLKVLPTTTPIKDILVAIESIATASSDYHGYKATTHIGAWIDNDMIYIEVSVNLSSLDSAMLLASNHKQLAIWDIANQTSIYLNKLGKGK